MYIYVTAVVKFKDEYTATAINLLNELVTASVNEEACIKYELYQDESNKSIFIIHEIWTDRSGLELHTKQPHYTDFGKEAERFLDGPVKIYKTDKLR